jgi:RecA-family ATPase
MAHDDDLSLDALGPPMEPPVRNGGAGPRFAMVAGRLQTFAASSLAGVPAPPRLFHVRDLIPGRTVTLLGGDGGTGKSQLAFQLAASTALSSKWLGLEVAGGRSLFITAEDDKGELHRRLENIVAAYETTLDELHDLYVVSLAGEDALLAVEGSKGALVSTSRFAELKATIADIEPALVVLDTLADVFGGQENHRPHARQFIGMLRGLAIEHDTTVVVLTHPSLTGMSSGSGTSGSTAWSNSVRSRLYLERLKDEGGAEHDVDARVLRSMKSNYGPIGGEVHMRWERGVFVPTQAAAAPTGLAVYAAKQNADQVFLDLVAIYEDERRPVSPAKGANYAPAVFAKDARAQNIKKAAFVNAMDRLLAVKCIEIVEIGPPSRRQKQIIVKRSEPA